MGEGESGAGLGGRRGHMAIAPQQLGIGIARRFTRPGVDPYDTVEWQRRDSRIQYYKDGGDAFFQAGVEFPTTWSLNATNIVAQKYFRGTLGTPEREWSLRQVIDRVVDTIADWGDKDGYFVDEREADAFRDELKFVLVHQYASFNSPVWFNIGVKGVPMLNQDRKSTRLNSSHLGISYAVFCLKKKTSFVQVFVRPIKVAIQRTIHRVEFFELQICQFELVQQIFNINHAINDKG